MKDKLLTHAEMAKELRISEATLAKLREEGKIPFGRTGRQYRYLLSAVMKKIGAGEVQGEAVSQ